MKFLPALVLFGLAVSPVAFAGEQTELATFAGGCFWCMEPPFDGVPGVLEVMPGYTGGKVKNPSYEQVSEGGTGHAESVEIKFDPRKVTYEKLLDIYWHQVDPTTPDAQFCDHGSQYRTAIFYHSEAQKAAAEASKAALQKSGVFKGAKLVTEITEASPFYAAEEYHRQYYKKNPVRYKYYRYSCGRDQYLDLVWGKDRVGRHDVR